MRTQSWLPQIFSRLSPGWLCFAVSALLPGPRLFAQSLTPFVCIEYVPASTDYVARYSYLNTAGTTVYDPTGQAGNDITPVRYSPTQTSNFLPGFNYGFSIRIAGATQETWFLGGDLLIATATSPAYYDVSSNTPAKPLPTYPAISPTCPVLLVPPPVPAAPAPPPLTYTAPGTYTNVFLAQVNAGPATAANALLSGFSTQPGITISNLTYVPGDSATGSGNTSGDLNPNSVYGTVTIAAKAVSGSYYLQLAVPQLTTAHVLLPITVTR